MRDRAPCRTPNQKAAFHRKVALFARRKVKRWGYRFRLRMRRRATNRKIARVGVKAWLLQGLAR